MLKFLGATLGATFFLANVSPAAPLDQREVDGFVDHMVAIHAWDRAALREMFSQARRLDAILAAISAPAEVKPWYQYRPIFVSEQRINGGIEFWDRNAAALARAATVYGVPPEMITAIIGVETFYGRNVGGHRVVDALGTLAFHYPKRAEFFRGELEQYLLLTREENIAPLSLVGSYAGAMGLPQFIASSFRRFAVDFDADGHKDIWRDPVDAIGSVANYFKTHGWQAGRPVVARATQPAGEAPALLSTDLMPRRALYDFVRAGLKPATDAIALDEPAVLLELEGEPQNEYWFGFRNFYVITRYNHSPKYAMAVAQLAASIRDARAGRGRTN